MPPTTSEALLRQPTPAFAFPFGVVALIGLASVLVPPYVAPPWVAAGAAGFLVASALVFWAALRRGRRTWLDPWVAYLLFPFATLVRASASTDFTSGTAVLMLLPILWLALTGTVTELRITAVLVAGSFLLPALLLASGGEVVGELRRAAVWTAVAWVLGPVVQHTVHALHRERAVAQYANVRVERLFDDAPHGVALAQPDGTLLRVNYALAAMVGLDPDQMVGRNLVDYEPPGGDSIGAHVERLAGARGSSAATDGKLRDSGGNDLDVALSSRRLHDVDLGDIVMVNVVDISERRRYQDRLSHLVDHDVLTGLPNRRLLERELERHLDRCRRYGNTGAVLLFDLDHFKQVNDTLGHNAGDELLVSIGGLLRRSIRPTDVVARLGGDEFAILLTDADREATQRVADLVIERVAAHAATLDGVRRRVTASVGAVTFQSASEQSIDILALADMTMYDAKEAGRNQAACPRARDAPHAPPRGCTGRAASRRRWRPTASSCTCSPSWTSTATASSRQRRCCACTTTGSWCRLRASSTSPSGPA